LPNVERIVGLTHRLGCRYTRIEVQETERAYLAEIDFEGPPDGLRRLRAQLNRLLDHERQMHR